MPNYTGPPTSLRTPPRSQQRQPEAQFIRELPRPPQQLLDTSIMTGNNASLVGLQNQSVPPQYLSQQSRSPQLLVSCLHSSASGAHTVLEGFPAGEDVGHERWKGSVGQSGELVEQSLQDGAQDAGVDWVVAGEEQA
jgi:hypothetical protein